MPPGRDCLSPGFSRFGQVLERFLHFLIFSFSPGHFFRDFRQPAFFSQNLQFLRHPGKFDGAECSAVGFKAVGGAAEEVRIMSGQGLLHIAEQLRRILVEDLDDLVDEIGAHGLPETLELS